MLRRLAKLAYAALLAAVVFGCAMHLADGRERELRAAPGVAIEIPADVATGAEGGSE